MLKTESRAYYRALGNYIQQVRKEHGMTQAELGRALSVSQQTVFAYELGDRRPSIFILRKLARVFSIPLEELASVGTRIRIQKSRVSPAILRLAERLQRLSKTQRRFVVRIIDVLLGQQTPGPQTAAREHATVSEFARPNSAEVGRVGNKPKT